VSRRPANYARAEIEKRGTQARAMIDALRRKAEERAFAHR